MNEAKLAEKLRRHYSRDGEHRVLFFMSFRPDELEESCLKKVFEISGEVLKRGKGKILECCYSQFLENGKVWNHRSEELLS
jgi:hypothetical protein